MGNSISSKKATKDQPTPKVIAPVSFGDFEMPENVFLNILDQLGTHDISRAARVNQYWNLFSNGTSNYKIITQLYKLAPFFFSKEMQYDPKDPECADALVMMVKKLSEIYKVSYVEVVNLFAAMNDTILDTPGCVESPQEALMFIEFLAILKYLELPFEKAAPLVTSYYKNSVVFLMGLLCINMNELLLEQLKLIKKECENDFDLAYRLIFARVMMVNSAHGADNPSADLKNALQYLVQSFSNKESEEYQQVRALLNELKASRAEIEEAHVAVLG